MAKNFKIADLKATSVYHVSLIDKWDGHAESRTMTGEELKSFTNAAAHLYDIHAEEREEENNMKEFTMMKAEIKQDSEKRKQETAFYIENGYFPTWVEEHCTDSERGLKAYSTACRWEQYQKKVISREKAVEFATKRALKEIEKKTAQSLAQLDRIANAAELESVQISVNWVRSRTWGYNPHVEAYTNTGRHTGTASGCGYDKESAAIAEALNDCESVLKALYTLKEKGLQAGQSDESATACSGRDNRNICGYGAGYGVVPYFEGGVGSSCFWAIFEKCGYKVTGYHGKKSDFYTIERKVEQ